jgi:hypothetical protein
MRIPRPGTEAEWCAGTAERCKQDIVPDACARWEQYCAAAAADAGASGNVTLSLATGGGCALTARSTARPGALLCLVLGWGLWFFRRRGARGADQSSYPS